MSRPLSSIEIAVLGLISGKTMGGSELQGIYQITNQSVWPSRRSGLWETTARLTKRGCLIDRGERHPHRWTITETGVETLSHAVTTANPQPALRFPIFVICAYLDYARSWDAAENVLTSHKAAWEEVLATEQEVLHNIETARSALVRARLDRSPTSGRASQLVKALALQGQVGIARTMMDWAEKSLQQLAELRNHGDLPHRPATDSIAFRSSAGGHRTTPLSPLQAAVLGLIGAHPAGISGSDLKRHYRATSAKLWPSEDNGLYQVTARLTQDGKLHDRGEREPDRFILTDAGVRALSETVSDARPEPAVRFPIFVACAYFEFARDWDAIEQVLLKHGAAWRDVLTGEELALADITQGRTPLLPARRTDPQGIISKTVKTLAFEGQIAIARFMIDWVEHSLGAIAVLKNDIGELPRPPLPEPQAPST